MRKDSRLQIIKLLKYAYLGTVYGTNIKYKFIKYQNFYYFSFAMKKCPCLVCIDKYLIAIVEYL